MKDARIDLKLREIEAKINAEKGTYDQILQIYNQVHRKKLILELNIKTLEQNKMDILQGQLDFDSEMGF